MESVVARWWELAIPVVGTLAGGSLGAWWQGRNSFRLSRMQAKDSEATQLRAMREEKSAQFRADRRDAYANLLAGLDRLRGVDLGYEFIDLTEKVLGENQSENKANSISLRYEILLEISREVEVVSLVAPQEVLDVLHLLPAIRRVDGTLATLKGEDSLMDLSEWRQLFLEKARRDLSVDG